MVIGNAFKDSKRVGYLWALSFFRLILLSVLRFKTTEGLKRFPSTTTVRYSYEETPGEPRVL